MKRTTAVRCKAMLLLAGLVLITPGCQTQSPAGQTLHPTVGRIENWVEDTGTVAYRDPYGVIPVVNGKIITTSFEVGDIVAAGQMLYQLDASDLEDQIARAELALRTAAAVADQSAAACQDLQVRTKVDGLVTALSCHEGDFVTAGTPVAQVQDSERLTLTVPFAPATAAAIAPGAVAELSFVAYPGTVQGTVERLYDGAVMLEGGRSGVYVEISFANPGALTAQTMALASVAGMDCMAAAPIDYAAARVIYAPQSGQVQSLVVEEGDAVTAGQTLVILKNAQLTDGAANAALSEESAALQLEQLLAKREDYTLTAPVAGVILTRTGKRGDYATASVPLATLAQEESMCVNTQIDEIYIDRIGVGHTATVTFTDDSGQIRSYTAQVRRIDESGAASGGVTDYTVELTLHGMEGLRAGMNVFVSILTDRQEDCLRLPIRAVSGGTVQVVQGKETVTMPVTVGISGGGYIQILDGLTEADLVLLP